MVSKRATLMDEYMKRKNAYFCAMEENICPSLLRWNIGLVLSRAENAVTCATCAMKGVDGWERSPGEVFELAMEAREQIAWLDYFYRYIFKERIDAHF